MKSITRLTRMRYVPEGATKSSLAAYLYPGMDFDTWLPEWWCNEMAEEERRTDLLFDISQFVWGYPKGRDHTNKEDKGMPLPLTEEASRLLERMPPALRRDEKAEGMETCWTGRPPMEEHIPEGMTVSMLADLVYPGVTYDVALPQDWVNQLTKLGFDPLGRTVWAYPEGSLMGVPLLLTAEAVEEAGKLFENVGGEAWG